MKGIQRSQEELQEDRQVCEGEPETHIHLILLSAPLSHTKVGNQSFTHT